MKLNVFPTQEMLQDPSMVIVDIRTEPEWRETGIVKGSHCITFFDADGSYDAKKFLEAMDALGGKNQHIGLICRTGNRTHQVAMFMHQQGYKVQNLDGGITKLIAEGYRPVGYRKMDAA
jgi:rhodanese-related sulfurtransferase